jgi:hypothetical protein
VLIFSSQAIGIEAAPKFQKASPTPTPPPAPAKKSNSVSAISSMDMDEAGNGGGADWGDDFDLSGDEN